MVDIEILWKLQQLEDTIVQEEKEMGIPNLILEIDRQKEHYNKLLQGTKKIAITYKERDALSKEVKVEIEEIKETLASDEEVINSDEELKPKALSNLEKNIDDTTKLLEEKQEELQLLKRENLSNIKQIKRLKSKLELISANVDSSSEKLKELEKGVRKTLSTTFESIEKINQEMTPETAKFYNEKKESLYPVLVPYNGDSCEGCKMQFSLMFIQDIEKNDKRSSVCESCGRIIMIPQTQEA